MKHSLSHVRGCLLGGAIGDALGAPIEFLSLSSIYDTYGRSGVTDYAEFADGTGYFTDDTQMTLFTAEGVLRAEHRALQRGIKGAHTIITHRAYLRWLSTQKELPPGITESENLHSWLLGLDELKVRREPGNACVSSLRSGICGTIENPINDSKGCGGVMRIAPAGLMWYDQPESAFKAGCELAAITHGHTTGYLSAGAFAAIIAFLVQDHDLRGSLESTIPLLIQKRGHEETLNAINNAIRLASSGEPSAQKVESLGGAWIAEEALAIALYCSLVHEDDFTKGVLLSINHSGDSDSTGAMTGNLLGLILSDRAIPDNWISNLRMSELVSEIANDLFIRYKGYTDYPDKEWERKYPPY